MEGQNEIEVNEFLKTALIADVWRQVQNRRWGEDY
jgi:hypothetical protein